MILKTLRKYVKALLWVTAILIIPSFILWGVGTGIRSRAASQEAGRIFGRRVGWDEYEASFRTIQILLFLSPHLKPYLQFINPVELAWDRLILLHEAKRRKLLVPDEAVVQYIQNIPYFRVTEGTGEEATSRFDQRRYEEILNQAFRLTPKTFEEEMRKTLLIERLRETVIAEVSVEDAILRDAYKKRRDKRRVSYLSWNVSDFEKEVPVTEKDLSETYAAHPGEWLHPEERRVVYAAADFEKFKKEEAKRLMDELFDLFLTEDFKKAAESRGVSIQETDFFTEGETLSLPHFSPFLAVEAFRREVGDVSDPIETDKAIVILKVLESRPARPLTEEEARPHVEKRYRFEKAEALARQKAEEILGLIRKKMAEESLTWEEAVHSLGVPLNESGLFLRDGFFEKLGYAPPLTHAAFEMTLGEISGVVQIPNGFALFQVEGEEAVSEESFLKEKETFREAFLKEKQAEYYVEWFKALRANAQLVSKVEPPETPPEE